MVMRGADGIKGAYALFDRRWSLFATHTWQRHFCVKANRPLETVNYDNLP